MGEMIVRLDRDTICAAAQERVHTAFRESLRDGQRGSSR